MRLMALLALAWLAVAACVPGAGAPEPTMSPSDAPSVPPVVRVPTPTEGKAVTGEVPVAILDPILEEAASLAGVAVSEVTVVRAEQTTWNDGALGCPEPGMMYTQALVDGYWVEVEAGDETYDFRVGSSGNFRLCPPGMGRPALPPGDDY